MGNKYTVEAGMGNMTEIYYGTEWLVIALWRLYSIELDPANRIYWKRLKIS